MFLDALTEQGPGNAFKRRVGVGEQNKAGETRSLGPCLSSLTLAVPVEEGLSHMFTADLSSLRQGEQFVRLFVRNAGLFAPADSELPVRNGYSYLD